MTVTFVALVADINRIACTIVERVEYVKRNRKAHLSRSESSAAASYHYFNMSSLAASAQMQSHRQSISGTRRLILLAIALAAASLVSIFNTFGSTVSLDDYYNHNSESSRISRRLQRLGMYIDPKSVDIKQLTEQFAEEHDNHNSNIVAADIVDNNPTTITTYTDLVHNEIPLPKYTLEQVIEAAATIRSKYAILRYDPTTGKFTGYYSKNQRWVSGCYKLMHSLSALTILLRAIFPERFTRNSPEFVMSVSSGDYPAMTDQGCISSDQDGPCDVSGVLKAPVLHFGSVFRKPMFPNMIGEDNSFVMHIFCHFSANSSSVPIPSFNTCK